MCIIIAKPKGASMPKWEILETCWLVNPDGAGFMFPEKGRVRIEKGFMTWAEFENALIEADMTHDLVETPLVIHFRIATHGKVKPENCHPFPVCGKYGKMHKRHTYTSVGLAHNGVISGLKTSDSVSDTMAFNARYVYNLYKHDVLWEPWALDLLEKGCNGSRLALLGSDGKLELLGNWHKDDGLYYSNTTYKASPFTYSTYCGYKAPVSDDTEKYPQPYTPAYDFLSSADTMYRPLYSHCYDCLCYHDCLQYGSYCSSETDAEQTSAVYKEYNSALA